MIHSEAGLMALRGYIHDIRNMLAVAQGSIFLLKVEQRPNAHKAIITDVENALFFVEELSQQLSGYLTHGDGDCEDINISDCVQEMSTLLTTITRPDTVVEYQLKEALPLIRANRNHLKKAIVNLVLNAAQSIKHHSGVIRISTAVDDCDEYVQVDISDNGSGMIKSDLVRVLEDSFSTKSKHSGIGLTNTKEFVYNYKGTLEAKSQPLQGTEITMRFPIECAATKQKSGMHY